MSRFEKLCADYRSVLDLFVSNREECFTLVNEMLGGLRAYLEAPEDTVSLFARHGQMAGKKTEGPLAALELRDDAYWHFGLVIDVYQEEGMFPYHHVAFDLKLKKRGDMFLLHVGDGPAIEIPTSGQAARIAGLTRLFEHLYESTRQRYANALAGFFQRGEPTARFGF